MGSNKKRFKKPNRSLQGVVDIERRKEIADMVMQIKNQDYIDKIYHYVLAKHRRDRYGLQK